MNGQTFAIVWTRPNGSRGEWHFGREDEAQNVAEQLRLGLRKDAHVHVIAPCGCTRQAGAVAR